MLLINMCNFEISVKELLTLRSIIKFAHTVTMATPIIKSNFLTHW